MNLLFKKPYHFTEQVPRLLDEHDFEGGGKELDAVH